jgi:hypothetical protein
MIAILSFLFLIFFFFPSSSSPFTAPPPMTEREESQTLATTDSDPLHGRCSVHGFGQVHDLEDQTLAAGRRKKEIYVSKRWHLPFLG